MTRGLPGSTLTVTLFPYPPLFRSVPAGVAGAARRGVRHHQHEAELGGDALGTRLHGEVLFRAGEAGEEGDHRDLVAASRLRRLVQGEVHRAVAHLGLMAVETLRPLEAALLAVDCQVHNRP